MSAERRGFRCTWQNVRSGETSRGSFWEDRESAEIIAAMLRRSPYVYDVEIVAATWMERATRLLRDAHAASGGGGDDA